MRLKGLFKACIPPLLWRMGKRLYRDRASSAIEWQGDYSHWASAQAASAGYDSDVIFQQVREAARRVRDGEALWERDSVCFFHEEYNPHLLTALLHTAARHNGALHVLDFGGALGSTYQQHKNMLSGLRELSWNVVEQAHVVECGQREFATDTLAFYSTVAEAFAHKAITMVVLSSVLQYMENPYSLVQMLMAHGPAGVYVGRTPFAAHGQKLTVQCVPEAIYTASYPCWFLSRNALLEAIGSGYVITPWTRSDVDAEGFMNVYAYRDV